MDMTPQKINRFFLIFFLVSCIFLDYFLKLVIFGIQKSSAETDRIWAFFWLQIAIFFFVGCTFRDWILQNKMSYQNARITQKFKLGSEFGSDHCYRAKGMWCGGDFKIALEYSICFLKLYINEWKFKILEGSKSVTIICRNDCMY